MKCRRLDWSLRADMSLAKRRAIPMRDMNRYVNSGASTSTTPVGGTSRFQSNVVSDVDARCAPRAMPRVTDPSRNRPLAASTLPSYKRTTCQHASGMLGQCLRTGIGQAIPPCPIRGKALIDGSCRILAVTPCEPWPACTTVSTVVSDCLSTAGSTLLKRQPCTPIAHHAGMAAPSKCAPCPKLYLPSP
jgi:hypothetical protein